MRTKFPSSAIGSAVVGFHRIDNQPPFCEYVGNCNYCNRGVTYLVGSLFGFLAAIWVGFGISPVTDTELYAIAVFMGVSSSSTMISSLCITANFVQKNGYGGGMVYSVVTFTDKLISGVVVLIVQNLQCSSRSLCPQFYQDVMAYIGVVVSVLGVASLVLLKCQMRRNRLRMVPEIPD